MQESRQEPRQVVFEPGAALADATTGSIFFIGNATVLLRFAGFTILTDPTFIHMHEQTWVGYGLHTTRLTNPAIEIEDLPPLDFILLSHFHGDHFDQVAEAKLDKRIPIITPTAAAKDLNERGFTNTYPLDTWTTVTCVKGDARLHITAMPGRHAPGMVDLLMPDVMGSLLEFEAPNAGNPDGADAKDGANAAGKGKIAFRLYITGDTLIFDDIKEIPRRYPHIDLALLHLGGTMVMGIMVTMDGKQGVEMLKLIQPDKAIPIHYNDYDLFKSPLSDFQQEVKAAGWADRVHYLMHGDTYTFQVKPR